MRRVLLLNVTYEPLTTVGLKRAVCLVLCDKADGPPESDGGQWFVGNVQQQHATHRAPPQVPL